MTRQLNSISYVSGTSDTPLKGQTIGDCFDETVARFPDGDALISRHQGLRYTWKELQEAVDQAARALLAIGVQKGERVGIWSPNCAEWTITQFATAKIGAILVNINPSYRTHELEYALKQSGASTLVLQGVFKSSDYVATLAELAPELHEELAPELHEELRDGGPSTLKSARLPELKRVICLDGDRALTGMFSWQSMLAHADEVSAEHLAEVQASLQFDDPINIQYTSGTTGAPKGATLSHHNILNNGFFVARTIALTDQDRMVIPVPLYHCFGMVMGNLGCMTHGATMIYPGDGFDPEQTLRAVSEEKATTLYGVPTMFIAELEHPDFESFDLSHLRTGIMAGSICPIEVMRKVIDRMNMQDVTICYGMTETSPVSLQTETDAPLEKRVTTVGTIHPHLEVKLVSPETGAVVPRGETGELCTRGYSVMLGYWNNQEATDKAIDEAGWMHTGDLATMDDEGYVAIVGRIKDMIIRGGENIYPREIEDFLYTHPAVSDVQVIGVPDEKYGEEVMAWIKLTDGEALNEEELKAFCKGKIAHYKVPRYVKFVDEFPMTVTGKIQKFKMREEAVHELGLK
ncbi:MULTISPECIES: AMP-binding protein [unclassified Halomonas]|uniref:AMP-binding protein n=1 Tax=unclassified Halomonas TaxID=2609666 RepID=UPI0028852CC6|nr:MULTISPECIES: AMP-binding protein [unclassified Halomonas]MDT0500582.1 AMP-binding protein [Halomonas sp. PAR7]MDT0511522.1 AMP-binding protein [Halomonas sp. LES1]MDT0590190.1 AMP-binding protein [Halomonas sp. PAR8]